MEELSGYILTVVYLALIAFYIYVGWQLFEKAGQPGWAVIIPIYNAVIGFRIAGWSGWWVLGAMVPILNLILLMYPIDLAKSFGKGTGFGLGLMILAPIFYPILALGDAEYQRG